MLLVRGGRSRQAAWRDPDDLGSGRWHVAIADIQEPGRSHRSGEGRVRPRRDLVRQIGASLPADDRCYRRGRAVLRSRQLDDKQGRIAQAALDEAARDLNREIATRIVASPNFHAVEDYHQDYYLSSDRILTRFGLIRKSDAYRKYREACGRDQRVREVWGKAAYETLTQ
jgi:hypothetical protein